MYQGLRSHKIQIKPIGSVPGHEELGMNLFVSVGPVKSSFMRFSIFVLNIGTWYKWMGNPKYSLAEEQVNMETDPW